MAIPEAKIAYRCRKELSEPTFGIVKEQMGFRRVLLRGLDNIKAETFMVATAFNLRSLYRIWHRHWNNIQEDGFKKVFPPVYGRFLAFTEYRDIAMSGNTVITC